MEKLKKLIKDTITDEEVYVDLTDEEKADYDAWAESELKKIEDEKNAIILKETAKKSLLDKLGISEDEAKLLI